MQLYISPRTANYLKDHLKSPDYLWEYDPYFLDFILYMKKEGSKQASKQEKHIPVSSEVSRQVWHENGEICYIQQCVKTVKKDMSYIVKQML